MENKKKIGACLSTLSRKFCILSLHKMTLTTTTNIANFVEIV